ncbi:MAG TPA: hypothetical protein VKE40_18875 [Gemmataceae bacterium]|nr:hypothetical protein [Gemmataceae bacterium]
MRMLFAAAISIGILCPIGCEQKSTTSPNPNNPNAPRKLTITTKSSQTITRGKTDDIDVAVTRKEFSGAVELEVKDLPTGVTCITKDLTIPEGKSTITLTLQAAADTPPVTDHMFHIVAKAKEVDSIAAEVKLTVKAK